MNIYTYVYIYILMCMILYDNTWILDDIGIMINDYTLLYIYYYIPCHRAESENHLGMIPPNKNH